MHHGEHLAAVPLVEAELGISLQPVSVPGAVVYAGPSYFLALERLHGRTILVDCGERAGDVLACLRTGLRLLMFSGPDELFARLVSMAEQGGAQVVREVGLPLLDPGEDGDLAWHCRKRLQDAAPGDASSV